MDKSVRGEQVNKKPPVLQSSNSNDQSLFKVPHPVAKKKSKSNSGVDYKNIAFTMSGEISSPSISRSDLFAPKKPVFFVEDTEDNDEQFISNMKSIIDKCQMQHKENYGVRSLQSKTYAARKKKCAFSDEDQNLMKRFKRSVDEGKAVARAIPRKSPQPVVASYSGCAPATSSPRVTPSVASTAHMNPGGIRDNQLSFQVTSAMQKNNHLTPQTVNIVTETEIEEEMIYCEVQFLTPPQENELDE